MEFKKWSIVYILTWQVVNCGQFKKIQHKFHTVLESGHEKLYIKLLIVQMQGWKLIENVYLQL